MSYSLAEAFRQSTNFVMRVAGQQHVQIAICDFLRGGIQFYKRFHQLSCYTNTDADGHSQDEQHLDNDLFNELI